MFGGADVISNAHRGDERGGSKRTDSSNKVCVGGNRPFVDRVDDLISHLTVDLFMVLSFGFGKTADENLIDALSRLVSGLRWTS